MIMRYVGLFEHRDEFVQSVFKSVSVFADNEGMGKGSTYGFDNLQSLLSTAHGQMTAGASSHFTDLPEDGHTFFRTEDRKVLDSHECFHDLQSKMFTKKGVVHVRLY